MKQTDGQPEDYLASGFRDVDAAAVDKMARCLAYLDYLPGFQQYKALIFEMMNLTLAISPRISVVDLVSTCGACLRSWVQRDEQSAWTLAWS